MNPFLFYILLACENFGQKIWTIIYTLWNLILQILVFIPGLFVLVYVLYVRKDQLEAKFGLQMWVLTKDGVKPKEARH